MIIVYDLVGLRQFARILWAIRHKASRRKKLEKSLAFSYSFASLQVLGRIPWSLVALLETFKLD